MADRPEQRYDGDVLRLEHDERLHHAIPPLKPGDETVDEVELCARGQHRHNALKADSMSATGVLLSKLCSTAPVCVRSLISIFSLSWL